MTKTCSKCKTNYPKIKDYFAIDSRGYFQSWCRECTQQNTQKWRKITSGVYGIFSNKECLYVGETSQLNGRISDHKTKLKNPGKSRQRELYLILQQYDNLDFRILEKTKNHLEREKYYINQLKPKYNAYGL